MTDQQETNARALLKKYLEGNCTPQEKASVEEWYLTVHGENHDLTDEEASLDLLELQHRLSTIVPQPKLRIIPYMRVAAAALLFLTIGVLWIKKSNEQKKNETIVMAQDIMPGSNRAILSLDGEQGIELSGQQEGLIIDGTSIAYNDGTAIREVEKVQMATLTTPIAGQYQVTLPDGTKAWLNAVSSIRYPTKFTDNKRTISITGEVYLEVVRDPHKPFVVHTEQQRIEVLGTSFNINAYSDNGQILTTLAEGSIKLTHTKFNTDVMLKPGQQAAITNHETISIKEVDTEEVSSWKDGTYIINNEPLDRYAKQIERWYDVEVEMSPYEKRRLSAIIPRDAKLSEVLQAIELKTGVKFKIEGRRVMAIR